MIYLHLKHAAGTAKLLRMFDITVIRARANENGAQLVVDSPIPPELAEHVEDQGESGHFIFGVWVKHESEQ